MLYPIEEDHNECHGDTQQKQQCNAICVMIREGQDLSGPWSPAKPLMRFYPNPSHVRFKIFQDVMTWVVGCILDQELMFPRSRYNNIFGLLTEYPNMP